MTEKWPDTYDDLYDFMQERLLKEKIYIEGFKTGWAEAYRLFIGNCETGPKPPTIPDKVFFGTLKDFDDE